MRTPHAAGLVSGCLSVRVRGARGVRRMVWRVGLVVSNEDGVKHSCAAESLGLGVDPYCASSQPESQPSHDGHVDAAERAEPRVVVVLVGTSGNVSERAWFFALWENKK